MTINPDDSEDMKDRSYALVNALNETIERHEGYTKAEVLIAVETVLMFAHGISGTSKERFAECCDEYKRIFNRRIGDLRGKDG